MQPKLIASCTVFPLNFENVDAEPDYQINKGLQQFYIDKLFDNQCLRNFLFFSSADDSDSAN